MSKQRMPSIIGGIIGVDYFKNYRKLKYRFLTHAHPVCYKDLPSGSTWPIYCSTETAAVLPTVLRENNESFYFNEFLLRPLALHTRYHFEEFTVTLLDANHVPGAVMFIFEGPAIPDSPVLYTGHFRADSSFYEKLFTVSILQRHDFGLICLDTTYAEAEEAEFPSHESSMINAVDLIKKLPKETTVYIVTLPLLNFKVLMQIAEKLEERIELFPLSKKIADIICPENTFGEDDTETRIFTVEREIARKMLERQSTSEDENRFCIVEMNVYVHEMSKCAVILNDDRVLNCDYAEQSSFNEIRDFLSMLRFRRLIGIGRPLTVTLTDKLKAFVPESKYNSGVVKEENVLDNLNTDYCLKMMACVKPDEGPLRSDWVNSFCDELKELIDPENPENTEGLSDDNVIDYENKTDIDSIAKQVVEFLSSENLEGHGMDAVLDLKAESLLDLVSRLEPDVRDKYEEACKNFRSNSKGISSELTFKLKEFKGFSNLFLEVYRSLQE